MLLCGSADALAEANEVQTKPASIVGACIGEEVNIFADWGYMRCRIIRAFLIEEQKIVKKVLKMKTGKSAK